MSGRFSSFISSVSAKSRRKIENSSKRASVLLYYIKSEVELRGAIAGVPPDSTHVFREVVYIVIEIRDN